MAKPQLTSPIERARSRSPTRAFEAKVLREAGIVGRCGPTRRPRIGATFLRWGASPATGDRDRGDPPPGRDAASIDERGSLTFERGAPALERARPRLRGDGDRLRRRRRDHVPQPPRLHRGDAGGGQARRQRPLPEHDVRRAAAGRGDPPRGAEGARLRRGVRGPARRASTTSVPRVVAWSRRRGRGADARRADRRRRRLRPRSPRPTSPRFVDPHLGDDRDAEGRPALEPGRAAGDGGAHRQDPATGAARRW